MITTNCQQLQIQMQPFLRHVKEDKAVSDEWKPTWHINMLYIREDIHKFKMIKKTGFHTHTHLSEI